MKNKTELSLDKDFFLYANPILQNREYQKMKDYVIHGKYTLYDHCFRVALYAYSLAKKKKKKIDYEALIQGALLHDFYLYDWHRKNEGHRLHGFRHPGFSYQKAKTIFPISRKVKNMILSHMFPLTFWRIPLSREAWILTLADKICAKKEHSNTFKKENKKK